jgi:hypothetical protein
MCTPSGPFEALGNGLLPGKPFGRGGGSGSEALSSTSVSMRTVATPAAQEPVWSWPAASVRWEHPIVSMREHAGEAPGGGHLEQEGTATSSRLELRFSVMPGPSARAALCHLPRRIVRGAYLRLPCQHARRWGEIRLKFVRAMQRVPPIAIPSRASDCPGEGNI